jgi:hypothetical protein
MKMKTLTIGRWGSAAWSLTCAAVCAVAIPGATAAPGRTGHVGGKPQPCDYIIATPGCEARSGSTCNLSYNYCASVGEDGTDRNCVSDSNDCMADLVNCSLVTDAWTSSDDCN